ncbi:MAG TPA: hypothetical protein VMT70_04670 [Vicinamibacteria bacterium]|nr:hypothetical protein [Vicinamibacteria bacterium]
MARALLTLAVLLVAPTWAAAWPAEAMTALSRDARKLLPRSLSRLLGERESQVLDEMQRFPPELTRAFGQDLPAGRLRPETIAALQAQTDRVVELLREGHVSQGLVRLGGLLRIPADLSDPVLVVGPEGWPPGLTREYYALFAANLDRMPVVLDDPSALRLARKDLPGLWQSLVDRGREQAPVLRTELFRDGRVVDHRRLDYRSPAWAVSSLAYSRAVTAGAATWLAVWREARGDTTRTPHAREVKPEAPKGAVADDRRPPQPEAP